MTYISLSNECRDEACSRRASQMFGEGYCLIHRTARDARWLSAGDLAELQAAVAQVPLLTEVERKRLRIDSRLSTLQMHARSVARSTREARVAGASDQQVTDAIAAGESDADS